MKLDTMLRVSEYLMGDLDSSSQPVPKTRSCDNLLIADESDPYGHDKRFASTTLSPDDIDTRLAKLADGIDLALRRAKIWSKYAKDVMTYIEKRCTLEAEHARNLVKLAQTMRPLLKEESFLPFQSIYCMALDQDYENSQTSLTTCSLLQGYKFIEPLTARRNEHEKIRKQIKETWHRELKKMHEAVSNLRKAKSLYLQRQQDYEKAKESALKAETSENSETSKVDKKRRMEDDACQKAMEAETTYKSCIVEANERQLSLEKIKAEVLKQVRELIYQCDQTMKAVTVGYFQLQHTISAPAPVQFQTLCESSRLYEPGTQYMEFVKRIQQPPGSGSNGTVPFIFEPYFPDSRLDRVRKSNGSTESSEDILSHSCPETGFSSERQRHQQPAKAWSPAVQGAVGSDSDSMSSCPSNKSQDTSPTASPHISTRKVINISSGDELETDHDNADSFGQGQRTCMSKAAETHNFRKLKTPSRCRECDCYVYFHGFECTDCGLASHKKCLEALAIQCGRKRLPRKMNTFGVDLTAHALEAGENVPYIVSKCIAEIEEKGFYMKGIYRVSGVKSKVEKLCQSFENGAELVDLDGFHPNVIANVLKLYLRQLPEPLLTFRLYPEFVKVAKDYPAQKDETPHNTEGAVDELQRLVLRLPAVHLTTLACLMHHLYRVSKNSEHNNMPPSNLGIVFGPTLLRTSEGSASLSSLVDTVHQTRVIELLITHAYDIFGPPSYLPPSQKDESYFRRVQAKSARYHPEKQALSRTVSGASQTSDYEELHHLDSSSSQVLDTDDYSLPGYIGGGKTQDSEVSRHGSDVTRSSEDLLYSGVMSDDDYPEILLSDDSVFKKSPMFTCAQSDYTERKSSDDMKQGPVTGKVQDTRASLSSSPAVSEASHGSSLLRSTDDESGSDAFWKDSLHPASQPRKTTPSTLPLNQSFLHGTLEKKLGVSSLSESSGVSSAASTSPTGAGETCQTDSGNVYTSTATVTLTGQKTATSPGGARTSTSSMTAELRRQFFETPTTESALVPRGSAPSLIDITKCVSRTTSEPQVSSSSSSPVVSSSHQKSASPSQGDFQSLDLDQRLSEFEGKSQEDFASLPSSVNAEPISHSPDAKLTSRRYISPLGQPSYRLRGSSLSFIPTLTDEKYMLATDSSEGRKTELYEVLLPDNNSSKYSYKTQLSSGKLLSSEKNVKCVSVGPSRTETQTSSLGTHEHIETMSVKHALQNIKLSSCTAIETDFVSFDGTGSSVVSKKFSEVSTGGSTSSVNHGSQHEQRIGTSEKLSPNRQPRFV